MTIHKTRIRWGQVLLPLMLAFTACQAVNLPPPTMLSEEANRVLSPYKESDSPASTPEPSPGVDLWIEPQATIIMAETMPILEKLGTAQLTGFFYAAQSGDTLQSVARRFGLHPQEIVTSQPVTPTELLNPGEILTLPHDHKWIKGRPWLIPDSEVIYGPSAKEFSVDNFLYQGKGSLSQYQEWLESSGWNSAAQIIDRVALENSINPRLLVSILEWECGCVFGQSTEYLDSGYVLGVEDYHRKSLYGQLSWAARTLAEGYYAWRIGTVISLEGPEAAFSSELLPSFLPPDSNAGTAALVIFFSRLMEARSSGGRPISLSDWQKALDLQEGFAALHTRLFGDPWERDRRSGFLLPSDLVQPALMLPFVPGWIWSLTSGPHPAWENSGALSALDFAPATARSGCEPSPTLVLAAADGVVVRSENGVVIQDLDSPDGTRADGYEGSGWVILYLHVYKEGRVPVGTYLRAGDPVGHPSCEGGPATGTHLHIARKYNGEWISADGPVPFVIDGWTAHNGSLPYEGSLTKGDQTITANIFGPRTSWIQRSVEGAPSP